MSLIGVRISHQIKIMMRLFLLVMARLSLINTLLFCLKKDQHLAPCLDILLDGALRVLKKKISITKEWFSMQRNHYCCCLYCFQTCTYIQTHISYLDTKAEINKLCPTLMPLHARVKKGKV